MGLELWVVTLAVCAVRGAAYGGKLSGGLAWSRSACDADDGSVRPGKGGLALTGALWSAATAHSLDCWISVF